MRRIAVAIGMIVVIGLAGSCGSSDDSSSDTTSKPSTSTTKAPAAGKSSLTSVSAIQSKLKSEGIDCAGKSAKPAEFYGVQAKEAVTCKVDGASVRITVYASTADRSKIQNFAASIACGTTGGKTSNYVTAGTWLLGADFKAKNAIEVNEKLATALDTKPIAVKC